MNYEMPVFVIARHEAISQSTYIDCFVPRNDTDNAASHNSEAKYCAYFNKPFSF